MEIDDARRAAIGRVYGEKKPNRDLIRAHLMSLVEGALDDMGRDDDDGDDGPAGQLHAQKEGR